jgi:hypothetical protein
VATPRQAACSAMTLRGQPPPVQTFLHPFGWPLSGHPTGAEHALHVSLQQQHVHTMRECEKSLGQRLPIWLGDGVLISTTNIHPDALLAFGWAGWAMWCCAGLNNRGRRAMRLLVQAGG